MGDVSLHSLPAGRRDARSDSESLVVRACADVAPEATAVTGGGCRAHSELKSLWICRATLAQQTRAGNNWSGMEQATAREIATRPTATGAVEG